MSAETSGAEAPGNPAGTITIPKTSEPPASSVAPAQRSRAIVEGTKLTQVKEHLFSDFIFHIIESPTLPIAEIEKLEKLLRVNGAQEVLMTRDSAAQRLASTGRIDFRTVSHIIASNIDFPEYDEAVDLMVPVVTPAWVSDSINRHRLCAFRPYSPDPKFIFSSVFVTVVDLPPGEKDAIYSGVRALGGQWSDSLTRFTTHLVTLDYEASACKFAAARNETLPAEEQVKILLPHWVHDCLKLRRRIDELPYLLPSPPLLTLPSVSSRLRGTVDPRAGSRLDVLLSVDVGAEYPENGGTTKSVSGLPALPPVPAGVAPFLNGRRFFLGSDLDVSVPMRQSLEQAVVAAGGLIVCPGSSRQPRDCLQWLKPSECDAFVGQWRQGDEYVTAAQNKLFVGNLNWLYWMWAHNQWCAPHKRLLHYPFVRGGLPEMKNFRIATANFSSDARYYLYKLIEAMGGQFTRTLTKSNTHLICARKVGKKYEFAQKWGVKIVNHLWIEECYANWSLQDVTKPRYVHFPKLTNLSEIVGQTQHNLQVLRRFYTGSTEASDLSDVSMVLDSQEEAEGAEDSIGEAGSAGKAAKSGADPRRELVDKENLPVGGTGTGKPLEIGSTRNTAAPLRANVAEESPRYGKNPPRKARAAAEEKLHDNIEDLNMFAKQIKHSHGHVKSDDMPLLPFEIEEREKRKTERASESPKQKLGRKRKSDVKEEKEEEKKVKTKTEVKEEKTAKDVKKEEKRKQETKEKLKKDKKDQETREKNTKTNSTKYLSMSILITGYDGSISRAHTKLMSELGIRIVHKVEHCTHLVAPRILRTEKFLCALAYAPDVLHVKFLEVLFGIFDDNGNSSEAVIAALQARQFSQKMLREFAVKDLENEKELHMSLESTVARAKKLKAQGKKLFEGFTFNITPGVPGGFPVVKHIVETHGAVASRVKASSSSKFDCSESGQYVMISKPKDKPYIDHFKEVMAEKGERHVVYDWNWVCNSILNMELVKEERAQQLEL